MSAVTVLLVGLGRFVQDLLLWSASEFNYMRIGDGFVQCSTIMPQKRNPVALEHARAIASTGVGRGQAIVMAVHNTPFGDIVDTEDDLQPLVFSAFGGAEWVGRMLNPKPLRADVTLSFCFDLSQAHLFDGATGKTLRG